MHRDVSEGNVMIADGRGFLHDLDYGFDWMSFLNDLGFEPTEESWEEFVRAETSSASSSEDTSDGRPPEQPSRISGTASRAPPRATIVRGHKEYPVDRILAERYAVTLRSNDEPGSESNFEATTTRKSRRRREYLVQWAGFDERTWEPYAHVRRCQAYQDWRKLQPEQRSELSSKNTKAGIGQSANESNGKDDQRTGAVTSVDPAEEARMMLECKQRTVSEQASVTHMTDSRYR